MGKKKKSKTASSGKVFRVTVLGRAEAGKSSLCAQFISNTALKLYEHTLDVQLYHREIDTRTLQPKLSGLLSSSSSSSNKKPKKKPAKKKKKKGMELITYGVQIEDVPGEITGAIENNTAEKTIVTRKIENNDGYKQLYHDTAGWLGMFECFRKKKII